MAISEHAVGSALGWPTPLACLYGLAMETGIGIRDYWHHDSGIAAIVETKLIALSVALADDGLRADVLAMALEVAIVMTNRPGAICAPGGFVVITPHRVPAPAAGAGKFATLVARACGRDTASAAFEYHVPGSLGDAHEGRGARDRLTSAGRPGCAVVVLAARAACYMTVGPATCAQAPEPGAWIGGKISRAGSKSAAGLPAVAAMLVGRSRWQSSQLRPSGPVGRLAAYRGHGL